MAETIDSLGTEVTRENVGTYRKVATVRAGQAIRGGTMATLEGDHTFEAGDYICGPGAGGEFWPVKRAIFEATYVCSDPASPEPSVADPTIRERLRELAEKATPGPWQWDGQVGQYVNLATVGRGVLTVMGTKRLGMNGSEPVFFRREPDSPWGWNGKAEPASQVAVRERPYRDDIADIDNPNAQLIVEAVNALLALLDALDTLERRAIAAEDVLERLTNYAEAAGDCYYGGAKHGCDHAPILRDEAKQARAALEASRGSA